MCLLIGGIIGLVRFVLVVLLFLGGWCLCVFRMWWVVVCCVVVSWCG